MMQALLFIVMFFGVSWCLLCGVCGIGLCIYAVINKRKIIITDIGIKDD